MAAADCKGCQKPTEGTLDHFEKLLEGPCPNHSFPVKHLYKDCDLMKRFLTRGFNRGNMGRTPNQPWMTLRGRTVAFRCQMAAS